MDTTRLRLGTRGSPLALAQAREVQARLAEAWPALRAEGAIEIVVVSTRGDRVLDRPLAEIGGKGLFTEEIEAGLLDGAIDLAVHSCKDMPTALPAGLALTCALPREDPRDVLLLRPGLAGPCGASPWDCLPKAATVGTSSLRRAAQLRAARPDLRVVGLRGNVQTRLRRLEEGSIDATLLARAGLRRLGLDLGQDLDPAWMLPAVAQGAIVVETRAHDADLARWLAPLHCAATWRAVCAERAMLARLEGSCRTPIAGLAQADAGGGPIFLRGLLAREDGAAVWQAEATDQDPDVVGGAVADALQIAALQVGA